MDIVLSSNLQQKLTKLAQQTKKSEQEVIIEALEKHLEIEEPLKRNCYDRALELGVIGVAENLPSDLSTNPDYFIGLGE